MVGPISRRLILTRTLQPAPPARSPPRPRARPRAARHLDHEANSPSRLASSATNPLDLSTHAPADIAPAGQRRICTATVTDAELMQMLLDEDLEGW